MEDKFEATFWIDAQPDLAWERLTSAEPLGPMGMAEGSSRWLAAWESSASDISLDEGRVLRTTKSQMPCKGTEIVIVLEAEGSGTRVTVVQSGFGANFESALDGLTVGWEHIVADLCLYLERGLRGARHLRPWAGLGLTLKPVPSGLQVVGVSPDTFAARSGIHKGDLLVTLGGAPMTNMRELFTIARVFRAGQELSVTWARGTNLIKATATL